MGKRSAAEHLSDSRGFDLHLNLQAKPVGMLASAHLSAQPASQTEHAHEYAFLIGTLIDSDMLALAGREAGDCGVDLHDVLLAGGYISEAAYASALARRLGVPVATWEAHIGLDWGAQEDAANGFPAIMAGTRYRVLDAQLGTPGEVGRRVGALRMAGIQPALAPRHLIEAARVRRTKASHMDAAVRELLRTRPAQSAASPVATWQLVAAISSIGLVLGGMSVHPGATLAALSAVIALAFLCVTLLRLVALREVVSAPRHRVRRSLSSTSLTDRSLPTYSVLVPLLREGNVLPELIQSLRALDYPAAKLEVLLILEAADTETQAALLTSALPGNFRVIVVPDEPPRTKPKALNYALNFASGDYIVVYDAEDRPQPDQLRLAADVFCRAPTELGCLQARLNIYNPSVCWLTRQFTIEYSALFDAMLPALERLRLPVPLGGTSNHLPRRVLKEVGGWDPFNVTEDADLGIRLARYGYRTAILSSTTWEEAPVGLGPWVRQRTRWLKGWMQTYLVHTRAPLRLSTDLGFAGAAGLHVLMGGLVLSALLHPFFYVLLGYHAVAGSLLAPAATPLGAVFWSIAWINLAFGYAVSILVGMISVWRRGRPGLALSALTMPLAWLLISLAAYRALYQLVRDPYLWEKTEHGVGRPGS